MNHPYYWSLCPEESALSLVLADVPMVMGWAGVARFRGSNSSLSTYAQYCAVYIHGRFTICSILNKLSDNDIAVLQQ